MVVVVRSQTGHRLEGDGPTVAAANRFLEHLVARSFSLATVRAYAFDLANWRFGFEGGGVSALREAGAVSVGV